MIYYLVIQKTLLSVDTLTQPNPLYGFLVIQTTVTVIGLLAGLISPFKKEDSLDYTPPPASQRRRPGRPQSEPTPTVTYEPVDFDSPIYMPNESPSREEYIDRNHTPTNQRANTPPTPCEYCGSFLDPDTEFCSVCGNRASGEY